MSTSNWVGDIMGDITQGEVWRCPGWSVVSPHRPAMKNTDPKTRSKHGQLIRTLTQLKIDYEPPITTFGFGAYAGPTNYEQEITVELPFSGCGCEYRVKLMGDPTLSFKGPQALSKLGALVDYAMNHLGSDPSIHVMEVSIQVTGQVHAELIIYPDMTLMWQEDTGKKVKYHYNPQGAQLARLKKLATASRADMVAAVQKKADEAIMEAMATTPLMTGNQMKAMEAVLGTPPLQWNFDEQIDGLELMEESATLLPDTFEVLTGYRMFKLHSSPTGNYLVDAEDIQIEMTSEGKQWRITGQVTRENDWRVSSVSEDVVWPSADMEAECRSHRYRSWRYGYLGSWQDSLDNGEDDEPDKPAAVHDKSCPCGIYACRDIEALSRQGYGSHPVQAKLEMWGRYIEGDNGTIRAQFAKIIEMKVRADFEDAEQIAKSLREHYQVPVEVVESLFPFDRTPSADWRAHKSQMFAMMFGAPNIGRTYYAQAKQIAQEFEHSMVVIDEMTSFSKAALGDMADALYFAGDALQQSQQNPKKKQPEYTKLNGWDKKRNRGKW